MTSSLLAAPSDSLGAQLPRHFSIPPSTSSTGAEAIDLAALAGLELDPWQQWCLTNALGERPDGKWAAFGVGVVVARQNGKGGILEARELAGLYLLEERLIIHSAHQFDTSQEAFERLVNLIESSPELTKRLAPRGKGITRSHGAEGIKLRNGQRIRFRTRTKGGGRGFTADCLILDEAMILPDAFVSATLPTLSSRPNPQVWYTGSAVDQTIHEYGVVLARVRERGLEGTDNSLFYAEWSAADHVGEVTEEMTRDMRLWAEANPALGIRMSSENIEHERREFGSNIRGFSVERLGAGDWPRTDDKSDQVLAEEDWRACADLRSLAGDRLCFAFDVSPNRSTASISVASERADGLNHVEVIETGAGTGWVVDRLAQLDETHQPLGIVFDPASPANSLVPELEQKGIEAIPVTPQQHAAACGILFDGVRQHTVRHIDQDSLNRAVEGAAQRPLGEAWAWSRRKSDTDITPLVTVTLANWAVKTGVGRFATYWNLNEIGEDTKESEPPRSREGFRVLTQSETTTLRWDPANGVGNKQI